MFEDNTPKGFGNNASAESTQEPRPRTAQKPRHHFDRDVVRPEIYVGSISSRFDSPGRRKTMEQRTQALGLTENDIRRLSSHHKVETFICLGSDSPLRLIDLLCLNEPELRSVYLEATESRKYQAYQLNGYQELLARATTSFEKDNLVKSINTVQGVLGVYCAFENTARDVLKCPKAARQTLLGELRAEKEADPSIYQQHKEMREKLAEVKSEKAELKKQVEALTAELAEVKAKAVNIDPKIHADMLQLKAAIHSMTAPDPNSELDRLLDEIRSEVEGTDIESGLEFHSYGACRALVIGFIKSKQAKNPNFWGTIVDHEQDRYRTINGHFNHGDVMQYIEELAADGAWHYAPNDLDQMPAGTKTYLADRLSGAMCGLEREGILRRERKGGHTVWATRVLT